MGIERIIRHLTTGRPAVRSVFPAQSMRVIEQAIRETETRHAGQIRFAVEASLELAALRRGQTASERALEIFSHLRVWDTEHNNGVLIYLLLADRDVEIVADRGIHARLGSAVWTAISRDMEAAFKAGQFEAGVINGIVAVGEHLQHHFPKISPASNELPDQVVVL
ncbi:MAG: TPM domain-containing protein [Pseudomonadota bacterium]